MPMVNIEISTNLEKKIAKLAKKFDRDSDGFLKDLLVRGIEEYYEDLEDLKAIRQYIADGGRNQKMIPMEEVLREFELEELDLGDDKPGKKVSAKVTKSSSAKNPRATKPSRKK